MNEGLKLIAAERNFRPKLFTKAGQKSFTDWCFTTLGLTTDVLKVLQVSKSDKDLKGYRWPDE
ncbi:hypothetical protein GCM10023189_36760 [Nibrella saemangeumensis]|uniref:Uncharacterized protein n=1 Tax=Nibrella saemangeumensis TaxID=1084526 RepID=A0ABP8N4S5_9BACT